MTPHYPRGTFSERPVCVQTVVYPGDGAGHVRLGTIEPDFHRG